MTSRYFLYAALLMAAGATSCTDSRNLANKIPGRWKGTSVAVAHIDGMDSRAEGSIECTPTLTFRRDGSKMHGSVDFNGVYKLSRNINSEYTPVAVRCTASATATAKGIWKIDDDSEIDVSFDPATVTAEIDPSSVSLSWCGITDRPDSELMALRNRIAPGVEDMMVEMIRGNISSIHEFEEVTVSGDMMNMEIDDRMVRFTRDD